MRHYLGLFRKADLINALEEILERVKCHGFQVLSLETREKDGGVFVKYRCSVDPMDTSSVVEQIIKELRAEASKHGGLPSWIGSSEGNIWRVRGVPWREVNILRCLPMHRTDLTRTCADSLPRCLKLHLKARMSRRSNFTIF